MSEVFYDADCCLKLNKTLYAGEYKGAPWYIRNWVDYKTAKLELALGQPWSSRGGIYVQG
jgi:hypothetical protein